MSSHPCELRLVLLELGDDWRTPQNKHSSSSLARPRPPTPTSDGGRSDGQGLGKKGQGNTALVKQFRKKDNAGIGGNAGTRDEAFRASQDLFNDVPVN